MTERAGTYARSATNNPDSMDRQREALRAHAEAHGYVVTEEVADNGVSGLSKPFERAGLGALLDDPAEWYTLVTYSLDRLSRDFDANNELEDWLTEHGKTLETVGGLRFPPLTGRLPSRPRRRQCGAIRKIRITCCPAGRPVDAGQ